MVSRRRLEDVKNEDPKSARLPVSLTDLEKRLALCQRFGVRSYRDGILSLDLESTKKPAKSEFPPVPEM